MGRVVPIALLVVLAVVIFVGVVRAMKPSPEAVIEILDGSLHVRTGNVSPRILREFRILVADRGIVSGRVSVHRRGDRSSLSFSSDIPRSEHQRFRNIWSFDR